MDIERARQLKPGDIVHFPADMGQPAGYGRVEGIAHQTTPQSTRADVELFVSVLVRLPGSHASVWPSNRLG
jgi:hypothetical protein